MNRHPLQAILRLAIVLSAFAAASLQAAELLTPKQFTDLYAEAVEAAYAGTTAEIVGDLEVEITSSAEQSARSYLDNAYANYEADPDALDDVLQQYVRAVANTLNPPPRNDIGNLFPVIKDNKYIAEVKVALSRSKDYNSSDPFPLHYERLNSELVVMYAFDSETGISFASTEDIEAFDVAGPALRERAVDNLMNYLPDISREGTNSLFLLVADGNYEASLLLADEIWTRDNFDVAGDIVVFVPARDVLLVTGSEDAEGLATARDLIANNEWSYFISEHAFVRTGDSWAVWDKP